MKKRRLLLACWLLAPVSAALAGDAWLAGQGGWRQVAMDDLENAPEVQSTGWWPQPGDGTLETATALGAGVGLRTARWDFGFWYERLDLETVVRPFTTQHTRGDGLLDLAGHAWYVTATTLPWRARRFAAGLGAGAGVIIPDGWVGAVFEPPEQVFDWRAATSGAGLLLELDALIQFDLDPAFLFLRAGYRWARIDDAITLPEDARLPWGEVLPAGETLPMDFSGFGFVLGLGLLAR